MNRHLTSKQQLLSRLRLELRTKNLPALRRTAASLRRLSKHAKRRAA